MSRYNKHSMNGYEPEQYYFSRAWKSANDRSSAPSEYQDFQTASSYHCDTAFPPQTTAYPPSYAQHAESGMDREEKSYPSNEYYSASFKTFPGSKEHAFLFSEGIQDDWLIHMIQVAIYPAGMVEDFMSKAFSSAAQKFDKFYPYVKYGTVYLSDGRDVRQLWADKIKHQDFLDQRMYFELINDIMHGLYRSLYDRADKKCRKPGKNCFQFHEEYIRKYESTNPKPLCRDTRPAHKLPWIFKVYGDEAIDRIYGGFREPNPPDSFEGIVISPPDPRDVRYPLHNGLPVHGNSHGLPHVDIQSGSWLDDSESYQSSPSTAHTYAAIPSNDYLEPGRSQHIHRRDEYMDRMPNEPAPRYEKSKANEGKKRHQSKPNAWSRRRESSARTKY